MFRLERWRIFSARSSEVFIKNQTTKELYRTGDTMKRLTLAKTLQTIADEGADAFYNGSLTDQIVKEIRDRGGIITREDLVSYTVDLQEALSIDLNNSLIAYTSHAPSSGPILAFILNLLEGRVD
jgi:gamma-glutamyltranspeptidase / glutathione hydrolase / leukotriene-C4 hydrolase